MQLYPAIDLYEGKVVRLLQGDFNQQTVYSAKPEDTASLWEREGAQWIHVVDLEGAKTGNIKNRASLLKIRKAVRCKIQFGGGIRTPEDAQSILQEGIDRVVIGTKSLDRIFLRKVLEKYGNHIAVGLDIHGGNVRMEGWSHDSGLSLETAVQFLNEFSVGTMIYTDIHKDGMLAGPNWPGLEQLLAMTQARIILSGGVSSLLDIKRARQVKEAHFEGLIIGKALYEKKITLKEAFKQIQQGGGRQ